MELKARIYDKKRKQMLYSHKPEEQGKREYYSLVFSIGFSHWSESELSEPMLCIDSSDKHGKEIYEGDILLHRYPVGTSLYKVEVGKQTHYIDGLHLTYMGVHLMCIRADVGYEGEPASGFDDTASVENLEIIGNVWEQPELLETREEANEPR